MKLEDELRLSYYKEVTPLGKKKSVTLVQHVETNLFYVKKVMKIYDLRVYHYLQEHPCKGIPKIVECVEDKHRLYIIEEFISGSTLRNLLDQQGTLSEQESRTILIELCDILAPLHALEPPIVHRDIKPENLIRSQDKVLYLVDFNSAKESESDKARDTVLFGTAGYAAPEQYGFSVSRPYTDIYAMGVLLNELLTGHAPSEGIAEGRFYTAIQTCVQMDPEKRYANVQQLKKALHSPYSSNEKIAKYALPGFRSHTLSHMVIAGLYYFFVILSGLTLRVETITTEPGIGIYRGFTVLVMLVLPLWGLNYMNVWSYLPGMHKKDGKLRTWLVVLIACFLIEVIAIITNSILVQNGYPGFFVVTPTEA